MWPKLRKPGQIYLVCSSAVDPNSIWFSNIRYETVATMPAFIMINPSVYGYIFKVGGGFGPSTSPTCRCDMTRVLVRDLCHTFLFYVTRLRKKNKIYIYIYTLNWLTKSTLFGQKINWSVDLKTEAFSTTFFFFSFTKFERPATHTTPLVGFRPLKYSNIQMITTSSYPYGPVYIPSSIHVTDPKTYPLLRELPRNLPDSKIPTFACYSQ